MYLHLNNLVTAGSDGGVTNRAASASPATAEAEFAAATARVRDARAPLPRHAASRERAVEESGGADVVYQCCLFLE